MIARIDKCGVVAMLAVREGCVCTGGTLCHSCCLYMGGAAPPQTPRFLKAVVSLPRWQYGKAVFALAGGCAAHFVCRWGKLRPPDHPPLFKGHP